MTEKTADGWDILEPRNLIVIGDGKGQKLECGGLLIAIMADPKYKEKVRYLLVFKDGDEYELAGNAALSQRISSTDVGKLIKVKFEGWDTGGGNKTKKIAVISQSREITTDEQKKMFPRWHDFEHGAPPPPERAEQAETSDDDDNIKF